MLNLKSIHNFLKNRILATIFLSFLIFIFLLVSIFLNIFYTQDKTLQRFIKTAFNPNINFTNNVIILAIDEKTLEELGRFPFSRTKYIPLIKNLNNLGASVIGFDIIFADKTDTEIDLKFAKTIETAGNIVLGGIDSKCIKYVKSDYINKLKDGECLEGTEGILKMPLNIFNKVTFTSGYFSPLLDKKTNKVYSFVPKISFRDNVYNHFTIDLLRAYYYNRLKELGGEGYKYNTGLYDYKEGKFKILDKIEFKLSKKQSKEVLINYTPTKNITTYSFIDLYNNKSELYSKLQASGELKGKIIIIGAEAKGIKDQFLTPLGILYGVNIHANILNTYFSKNFLSYFNYKIELLILFLVIFLSVYLFLDKKIYVGFLGNVGIVLFLVFLAGLLSISNYLLNYPIEILLGLFLGLTFSNLVKFLIENRNKKVLVKALGEYISKDIANKILTDNGDLKLDGEDKKISIFFSDIAGFTTISEKMDAERLVDFLREYLGSMSNIIMDERGFINKYEGDAIMALFGVFGYNELSTYDNCKAALLQQARLKILNKGWEKQFGEVLKVRMGIHTGNAIIGNIGAKGRKMEYTALGDSVNLASRLEGVNKFYGTYICVSENVVNEVGDKFEFRKLDKIRVKGKNIPIEIYELLGEKGKISDLKKDIKTGFEKALEFYFNKEFKKAGDIFKKLGEIGDPASLVFSRRCFKFEISGVKKDWDGVWTMEEK